MEEYALGLDVGSTTLKLVILDKDGNIVFEEYRRHLSDVRGGLLALLQETAEMHGDLVARGTITGSGGLAVADIVGLPFVQEVVSGTKAAQTYIPEADVLIELGGEDAKITYMHPSLEQRMNGTCAGGTGAFIDQMAALLGTDASGINDLAEDCKTLYPIAARCGVFAKTDVQPLINDGAAKEDIAASILQAVVNQTIAGLACGRPIKGKVAFLGGPLHYLPSLRKRFVETLHLCEEDIIHPDHAHLFVALGAALMADSAPFRIGDLAERLMKNAGSSHETRRLAPLFSCEEEKKAFFERHSSRITPRKDPKTYEGPCYLGIDAGSTTIKAAVISKDGEILLSHYQNNGGMPLEAAVEILHNIYSLLSPNAWIAGACVTGYGESMIKEALRFDEGEVETVAHLMAARHFDPEVDFIIDIGGQDMKCLKIKDGVIEEIMLNEACSSGCGSFLESFSSSLGMPIADFGREALQAEHPVDLGTRCTVFMNSRVKQAQKEGANVGDISAGLSYSVVKNALYKVIKIKDPQALGKHVVVQGGTFKNDAILRAFEKELQRHVVRPDIAELMGAYGACLIARQRDSGNGSSILSKEELEEFGFSGKPVRCQKCGNHCMLTVTKFADGRVFISGNRCEKGAGREEVKSDVPNLYDYKYQRVFDYTSPEAAPLGEIGIPRALNIYENYPFWFTLLTRLGFKVVLSDPSSHDSFSKAMETIPSESVCYPAKLVHGHIHNLVEKGLSRILYPSIPYERVEYKQANNNYNCPIVTSYPEVIKHNMDILKDKDVDFIHFFAALDEREFMPEVIFREFSRFGITKEQAEEATEAAYAELLRFKQDVQKKGEETIRWLEEHDRKGIVLVGRPYHVDPEIHHGIPQLIQSYGLAVLTEDSVAHLGNLDRPIRVMDQWAYHTRLYEAASEVAKNAHLELIQLNSFGCGLDAITADEVQEIVGAAGKVYTLLKIDEISNLGAAKIRIRSLLAALQETKEHRSGPSAVYERRIFTRQMRKEGTIVCPQLAPLQFQFLKQAFDPTGYNFKVLTEVTKEDIDVGLKYVNNDACYPTIIVVGQLVNAFIRGELDPDHTVIMLTQTGGGCRASNYLAFLRKALKEAGYPQVCVASINFSGLERNPGLKFTIGMAIRLLIAISLGDLLQRLLLATRPYEVVPGQTNAVFEKWVDKVKKITRGTKYKAYKKACKEMVEDFDAIERIPERKPKVGLVGEILVKYHPDANNHAIDVIEAEGAECVMPALMEFFTYSLYSAKFKHEQMGKSKLQYLGGKFGVNLVNKFREPAQKALEESKNFEPFTFIEELGDLASTQISQGNCTGEGWFLTAEMLSLIKEGAPNIICVQPFACLPNHVVGKGMIRAIRDAHPEANIVAVDYDPGASEVNQLNRIKLMIYQAFQNLQVDEGA